MASHKGHTKESPVSKLRELSKQPKKPPERQIFRQARLIRLGKRQRNQAQGNLAISPENEPESCASGSIEQQLDMCEQGALRGDEILHDHGVQSKRARRRIPDSSLGVDKMMNRYYEMDLAEESREGDEMSGDDHSSGLQGEDFELMGHSHLESGMPGDRLARIETNEQREEEEREGEQLIQGVNPARIRHLRRIK